MRSVPARRVYRHFTLFSVVTIFAAVICPVFREPRPTKLAEPSSDERELIPTGPSAETGCRDGFPADTVPVGIASRVTSRTGTLSYTLPFFAAPEPAAR
jgi:hypothetical protein